MNNLDHDQIRTMKIAPMLRNAVLTLFLTLFTTLSAGFGGYIHIDSVDGSFALQGGQIDGILGGVDHTFSTNDLDILAATLQNDGIETQGRMSFLLASTDAGYSFIGLFGGLVENDPTGSVVDQYVGVSATSGSNTDWFASGDQGSQVDWYDMGNNNQLITALLGWDHDQTSAAFAWGNVPSAPTGTINLYDVDFTEYSPEPIQFITYVDGRWSIAEQASFSVLGQYAFSHQFVPTPGALALLTLAGLTHRRRRK